MNQIFKPEALERLKIIFPTDGVARFARLEQFMQIASRSDFALVVPPAIDTDLHEVLSARGEDGRGLELCTIGVHTAAPHLGKTVGLTLSEVQHPDCKRTLEKLLSEGFTLDESRYGAPACLLQVVAS